MNFIKPRQQGQVLDKDQKVISGLYAVGEATLKKLKKNHVTVAVDTDHHHRSTYIPGWLVDSKHIPTKLGCMLIYGD